MFSRKGWRPFVRSPEPGLPVPQVVGLRREDFDVFRAGYADQVQSGFRPRGDLPPVRLEPPVDWATDPFGDRNWSFQLQAWRMLAPIWQQWYGVDWARLKAEVLPWINDWHDFQVVQGRDSPFSWYDMSAGLRAQHLALVAHLHRQGLMPLDEAEWRLVRDLSELHVAKLRSPGFVAMNNHGLFQLRGLRLLGIVWRGESFVSGEEDFSTRLMKKLLGLQFDEHGMHVENSPDYHGLMYRKFAEIRPELFPGIEKTLVRRLKQAKEILPWFTFPDQSIANIGDSAGTGESLSIRAKPDHVLTTPIGEFWIRDLSKSGYAIARSSADVPPEQASMLVVKAQALTQTHSHADHLGLLLYHAGHHLLTDSGKFSYNHGPWRDYFVSDRAHNVVGLANASFGPQHTTTVGPGLDGISIAGDSIDVEGEIVRREFLRHRRKISYQPGKRVTVIDQVDARPGDAPVAYWHLAIDVDAEKVAGGVELFANGTRIARITVADPDTKARLVSGQTKPRIQGWISRLYAERAAATVVEFRAPPNCRRIETLIELHDPLPLEAGKLPRRLCHGIRFRFPFVFRFDRVQVLPDGRTRRKVTVDLPEAYPSAVATSLMGALLEKGFETTKKQSSRGAYSLAFSHHDRTRATVHIRQAEGATPARLALSWERAPISKKKGNVA